MDKSYMRRFDVERDEDWRKWIEKIPALNFKEDWDVKVIPPFGGAIARVMIVKKGNPEKHVSVYLDCYDALGCMGEPYWEMYPYEGDTYRALLNNTDDLIEKITEVLDC